MKFVLVMFLAVCTSALVRGTQYTNQWVADIRGGDDVAKRIAGKLGFNFEGQVGTDCRVYMTDAYFI